MSMTLRNVSTFRQKNNKNISPSDYAFAFLFKMVYKMVYRVNYLKLNLNLGIIYDKL